MGWRPGFETAIPVYVRDDNGWLPEGEYLGSREGPDGNWAIFVNENEQDGWWIDHNYVSILNLIPCLGGE